ncbi:RNase H family protein [Acidithiobacillus thiooxidans]|nr:RNase H family protein [Acidithiobacillus thiooxidans]
MYSARKVQVEWVRGHNGHPENEKADQLANRGLSMG